MIQLLYFFEPFWTAISTFSPDLLPACPRMLYRKMGEAGVSLVYPENLSIFDKEGKAVDIERGLRQKHFPIRVRYILTSDTYAPKPAEQDGSRAWDLTHGKQSSNVGLFVHVCASSMFL